jgi:hypothetical protein
VSKSIPDPLPVTDELVRTAARPEIAVSPLASMVESSSFVFRACTTR